jgi:predicted nucleic acid-binding protein
VDTIRLAINGILRDIKAALLAVQMGGLSQSTLYRWGEMPTDNNPHTDIPLARAIQLTLITKDTRLISAIAAAAGGTFIPGRQLVEGRFESERTAVKVMKASAALIEDFANALEDGKVTATEYKELAREAMNVHLSAAAIVECSREKAGL